MTKIGIIAGGGELPLIIAQSLHVDKVPFYIIAINGEANSDFSNYPHSSIAIGQVGQIISTFKSENVTEIVLAGKINRPSFASLTLDSAGVRLIGQITKAKLFGDDSVLACVIKFLESEGFIVKGAENYTTSLLAPFGCITRVKPNARDEEDIAHAIKIASAIGSLDIGQAVIVEHGLVLGVEAVEGTDQLISRCGLLKREKERAGVLVKMKKPTQDSRVDLPTIGVSTIQNIYDAGFAGVGIQAGSSFIIGKKEVVELAEKLGIFVVGVK